MAEALYIPLLAALLYLPGHFLGGRLAGKGDAWTEVLLLRLAASAAVALPVLLALTFAGWFAAPVICAALAACAVAAYLAGHRARPQAAGLGLSAAALVGGAFALYGRPAEYVVNNRDPGVYTVLGARLARTGNLIHRDALVEAVSGFHAFVEGKKYPAVFVMEGGYISPQFFPGPFAVFGLGNLLGGIWGGLYVVPLLGALSVGLAYILGKELFGRWAGLCGAALLGASYAQVWWARHPSSEVMSQFFVLGGLLCAARFAYEGGRTRGVLAGMLLGGAMLVRVDGFLAAAAIPLLFGYDLLTRREALRWLWVIGPLAASAAASLVYLNTAGARYLYIIYDEHGLREALALVPFAAPAALAAIAGLLYVRWRWGERIGRWTAVRGGILAVVVALGVVGLALWGYFVAPVPWESLPVIWDDFNAYRSQILLRMVWFVTPPVAILALAGLVLVAARLDAGRSLLLGAVLAFGLLYTFIPNVAPDVPWATRRFVPAVFPGVCLLAGYAIVRIAAGFDALLSRARRLTPSTRLAAGAALSVVVGGVALGWTVHAAYPILGYREFDGAVGQFDRVDRELQSAAGDAEAIFMQMPPGFDYSASTFDYLYGYPVLPYDEDSFVSEAAELQREGLLENAAYVTVKGEPAPLVSGVEFEQVGSASVDVPRLGVVAGHEPQMSHDIESLQYDYRIYRIRAEDGL